MKEIILQTKVTNKYNKNGATLTELIQVWMNEKNFFENSNNDNSVIEKYIKD